MTRAALVLTVLITAATSLPAAAGPPGFAFLEIPIGARASGLGGAYASVAEGVEGAYWNPAALELARGLQVTGGHYEMFQKLRSDYFAVAGPLLGGGMSGSIRALYSEAIDERDELGNLIGSFGAHDLEFALGYGRAMGSGLSLGGSAQVVRERISNSSATSYAFNVGTAWESQRGSGWRVAASGYNLGPPGSYQIDGVEGEPVPLPTAFQTGVSYAAAVSSFMNVRGVLETRVTRGRNAVGMVGTELGSPSGAALRLGVRVEDSAANLSLGAGYGSGTLSFDYAYVPMPLDLGDTHRFSFMAQF
jgi:hypothetical protein